ncbi:MAG: formate dehydrogenase [Rubrivivax sp.]|nr:formate dehydrogenase [Rubrivivax sp.]
MNRDDHQPLARRTLLAGAGTVGALAATAALVPRRQAATTPTTDQVAQAPSTESPGYRLTEHVAQYYRTARV